MNRKVVIGVAIGFAIVLAAGGGAVYSAANSTPKVGVTQAKISPISTTVRTSGTIITGTARGVYPAVSGTISKVLVLDGDTVKKGDVLAELDTAPLKQALKQAKASLAAAKAQLEVISWTAPTSQDRSAASAAVGAARSALSTANSNYSSYKALYNAASSVDKKTMVIQLRSLKSAKTQASAALKQAQAAVKRLQLAGNVGQSKNAANLAISVAKDAVAKAEKNLDAAALKAPIDGVVNVRQTIEKGSGATPGVAAFTIIDPGDLIFRAAVDEDSIPQVALGQEVTVALDSIPNQEFSGRVTRISATPVTALTGSVSYPVEITFEYGANKIFQGMSGSANISTLTVADALTVPVEAVISGSDGKHVFVLRPDETAAKTEVQIGAESDTAIQIVSGLKAGDQIITVGATTLADGQSVKVG